MGRTVLWGRFETFTMPLSGDLASKTGISKKPLKPMREVMLRKNTSMAVGRQQR